MTLPDLADSYRLLTSEASAVRLARDAVRVSGPDAASWLQGQVSQDVLGLSVGGEGSSAWSFILAPQGKVDAWFRITRESDDSFLLDLDPGFAEALVERLNRFKLRINADVEVLAVEMVAVRQGGTSVDVTGLVTANGVIAAHAPFFGDGVDLLGVDLLGEGQTIPEGITEVSPDAYEVARIEAGMPRMGVELTAETIPAASGVVDLSASFTKGCYTGQELVARVDSRGNNTPTHLRVLRTDGKLAVGDVLGDGQGTVTSATEHPDGGSVGLGYVKRSVEVPASLPGANSDVVIAPVPSAASTTD